MCDSCLISRGQYLDDVLDTLISDVRLDTADSRRNGLGRAVFVEQCRCPRGYTGISCQVTEKLEGRKITRRESERCFATGLRPWIRPRGDRLLQGRVQATRRLVSGWILWGPCGRDRLPGLSLPAQHAVKPVSVIIKVWREN